MAGAGAAAAAASGHRLLEIHPWASRIIELIPPSSPPPSIRAAHCLTSVQFSPGGGHLLLAYGKKHISLLRSLVAERGAVVPLHTILEVVRWVWGPMPGRCCAALPPSAALSSGGCVEAPTAPGETAAAETSLPPSPP